MERSGVVCREVSPMRSMSLLAAVCLTALLTSCARQDTGPRQPVAFSHEIHAGQYKIDCQHCHSGARRGPNAYVPSMQTCMGCHQLVAATKPEIIKVRQLWEAKKPIVWTRMNKLSDFVFFNHQPHISKGVACVTCHGDLTKMPEVKPPFTVNNMTWCVDCHRENKASIDCYVCHR